MKMVDFDVAEHKYRRITNIDEDIAKLHYPQKYVLLEAFNEIYGLEVLDVTDTAVYLKLTDKDIKHYCRCEQSEKNKMIEIIDKKITELDLAWYGAEDGSKEEKEANLQLKVLEEVRDKIKGEWRK